MPVDRSTLPPLPGKPDWYLENAPQAIDLKAEERSEDAPRPFSIPSPATGSPVDPFRSSLGVTDPPAYTAAPQFPTAQFPSEQAEPEQHHGRKFGKVKAFAGRIKH